jgi:hypothetical protein
MVIKVEGEKGVRGEKLQTGFIGGESYKSIRGGWRKIGNRLNTGRG